MADPQTVVNAAAYVETLDGRLPLPQRLRVASNEPTDEARALSRAAARPRPVRQPLVSRGLAYRSGQTGCRSRETAGAWPTTSPSVTA